MKKLKQLLFTLAIMMLTPFIGSSNSNTNQDTIKAKADSIVYTIKGDTNTFCFSADAIRSIALIDTLYSQSLTRINQLEEQGENCIMLINKESKKLQVSEMNFTLLEKDYEDLDRRHSNLVKGLKLGGLSIGIGGVSTIIYFLVKK